MHKYILTTLLYLFSFALFAEGHSEAAAKEKHSFDLNEVLIHHLMDHAEFPFNVGGKRVYEGQTEFDNKNEHIFKEEDTHRRFHFVGGFDMHITRRVTMMWIACFLMLAIFIPAAHLIAKNPLKIHSRFTSAIEALIGFLKTDIVDKNMHGHGHGYYHYIFTLFFFILFSNLLGIIPPVGEVLVTIKELLHSSSAETVVSHDATPFIAKVWNGITVTGDVSVTMTLALCTLGLIYGTGFVYQGFKFIPHSVPNGVPLLLWPIMWPLEFIISPLAKAFALTVRLLANMTAGHVIILALLGFIFEFRSPYVVPVSIFGAGLIYVLEIFVAFLQAYIFALLTSLFVGSAMHRH